MNFKYNNFIKKKEEKEVINLILNSLDYEKTDIQSMISLLTGLNQSIDSLIVLYDIYTYNEELFEKIMNLKLFQKGESFIEDVLIEEFSFDFLRELIKYNFLTKSDGILRNFYDMDFVHFYSFYLENFGYNENEEDIFGLFMQSNIIVFDKIKEWKIPLNHLWFDNVHLYFNGKTKFNLKFIEYLEENPTFKKNFLANMNLAEFDKEFASLLKKEEVEELFLRTHISKPLLIEYNLDIGEDLKEKMIKNAINNRSYKKHKLLFQDETLFPDEILDNHIFDDLKIERKKHKI